MSELDEIVIKLKKQIQKDQLTSLKTSGTTGTPKIIKKNIKTVFDNCKINNHYEKTDVFGFLYNLDSWAATSVIIHCIKNNITPYKINLDLPLREQLLKVSYLSITPTFLKLIAMNMDCKIQNVKKIVLGGEYSNQQSIDLCKKYFPNSKIVTIYSSTETGDIATSSDMLEGFSKDKFKDCKFDNNNCLIKGGINTGDIWELYGDRYYFKGRIDNCIKIAGNLVSLDNIEAKIKNMIAVDDLACIVVDVPIIGKSYKLIYVGKLSKEEIKNQLKKTFKKYEMPTLIKKVKEIGFGKNYKKIR